MTQPILRVLIQQQLADGRSPRIHIPRIWGGLRNGKGLLRGLALAAFAALGTMVCAASAGATTKIDVCTDLSTFGETYVLTANLTSCGTCLVVANDRITIDLAGRTISAVCAGAGAGITDLGIGVQGTTVRNGTIKDFDIGVSLGSSDSTIVRNLVVSDNFDHGLILGLRSFVQGSTIVRNGQYGIIIGDFGQVRECVIGGAVPDGNGRSGIFGASRLVIANNMVVGNESGIVVSEFSIVSSNTSSNNTFFGVLALGKRNLITGNTTNGNGPEIATSGLSSVSDNISSEIGGVGVQVSCPSTVTNNKSSDNGSFDYHYDGPGCQIKNNK